MKRWVYLTFFILLYHAFYAQRLEVKIHPDSIRLGEPVALVWTLTYPDSGYQLISSPAFLDTGRFLKSLYFFPLEKGKKNGLVQIVQKQVISAYDSGNFVLPFRPALLLKGKDTLRIFPDSVTLFTTYVPIDTSKPIKDIKDIIHPDKSPFEEEKKQSLWWWIIAGALLLIAAFLIYYFFFRKKKTTAAEELAHLKPWERALHRLKSIKENSLWLKYEPKVYYTELTDVIRKYLEEEFGIDAEEMISREIIEALERQHFDLSMITIMRDLLLVADMAKFASEKPQVSIMEYHVHQAILFVEKTHKAEEVDENAGHT